MKILRILCFALLFVVAAMHGIRSGLAAKDTAPAIRYGKIPAPEKYGAIIAEHVCRMYAAGYFRTLSQTDFYHGHIVFPAKAPATFASLEDALDHTVLFIYHSDESLHVWNNNKVMAMPLAKTQRSIAGYRDGRIEPAVNLVLARLGEIPMYDCCGKIETEDLARLFPDRYEELRGTILLKNGKAQARLFYEFTIEPDLHGRYEVNGVRYEIYFETMAEERY